MARSRTEGAASPHQLQTLIDMTIKTAREAGQTDCVEHLRQARNAISFDSPDPRGGAVKG